MRERVTRQPLFAGVSSGGLDDLVASVTERTAAPGEVLVERGQPGSGIFVLEEGSAVVELGDRSVELGPGDVFGEMAVVGVSHQRTARVRAVTDARCLSFSRVDLERVLDGEPELAARLRALAEARFAAL